MWSTYRQIELELTESLFFNDSIVEKVREFVQKLHECGFLFSMDDFGSGYSSFRLLMELDVVKLDRKFFVDIENEKVQFMLMEIVKISHQIGAKVVAEGVETQEQLSFVREIGCDMVQGFVYSRPLPPNEFEKFIGLHM